MKRTTAQRFSYNEAKHRADRFDTFGRPSSMPPGFWKSLIEILGVAAIAGTLIGAAMYVIAVHHIHPQ